MKSSLLPLSLISLFISSIIPATAANPSPPHSAAIVIGFVGGMVGRSNAVHSEVRLATRLRNDYPTGVQVRMFENRHGDEARREILQLLDTNRDGQLSSTEKRDAHITIYGHSWGASEAITLARALGEQKIPVLLTIQVDSVRKPGENDGLIPANVVQAVNFFQRDGLLHGRSEIRAADSSRTKILGNFEFDYRAQRVDLDGYPWYARLFMKPHIEIESDPRVWGRVESLIRSKLPQVKTSLAAAQ